jgi:SNF2 family DNA or RNA helicase
MPQIRLQAGNYWAYAEFNQYGSDRYSLKFRYNPHLISEIKSMEGARWDPTEKIWTVLASERNQISLEFMTGGNPYKLYFEQITPYSMNRKNLMNHQINGVNFCLNRRQCLLAHEMGCGKTLAAIEIMESSGHSDWLWVGPKSALRAVEIEFYKWGSSIMPILLTYDSLKKHDHLYKGVVFDESHKLKNPSTQRYEAAKNIVRSMRAYYKNPYVILLTGSPAPNSPADWWSQIELICPGFIKESTVDKFKKRMGLFVQEESLAGGKFPKLITWWSNELFCRHCGKLPEHPNHDPTTGDLFGDGYHMWEQSINQVQHLYEVMKPMVNIVFKKDVLELPDKHYRIINCPPDEATLRAARLIVINAKNAATAAIQLREISDGFLYRQKAEGFKECELCHGKKIIEGPVIHQLEFCPNCGDGEIQDGKCIACGTDMNIGMEPNIEQDCPHCGGTGEVSNHIRVADQVPCPKEDVLKDLLEEFEDAKRVVIYAGFTGSVDRCLRICNSCEWETIKIDGRGWNYPAHPEMSETEMLKTFQNKKINRKIALIAQPDSGGLGLTLTASPVVIFYSNSTIPGSRSQSEDRIHRPGIDLNKGATIIDLIHLPTDQLVLDKLKLKQKIQGISLGEFRKSLDISD